MYMYTNLCSNHNLYSLNYYFDCEYILHPYNIRQADVIVTHFQIYGNLTQTIKPNKITYL